MMMSLVFIVIFFLCLGIAVAAVLISYQLIQNYNTNFHKNYFYYLISFYAFAFYGIWGQLLVRILLEKMDTSVKVVELVANFLPILGVPFLFIGWIMLINMAYSIDDEKIPAYWKLMNPFLFIVLAVGSWLGYNYLSDQGHYFLENNRYLGLVAISIFETIYYLIFTFLILFTPKHKPKNKKYLVRFALIIFVLFIVKIAFIPFVFSSQVVLGIGLLVYFLSGFLPLFYLRLHTDVLFVPIKAENTSLEKIDLIYKKYKITKREKEIVEQICQGKTNQQIADDLFISLQTVKDHTHRIYSKIGIRSRMQLVQFVN